MAPFGNTTDTKMSTKKDYIYEEILGRLFNRRYRFGDPITVKEISEETGVSRQPIMTALYRLQDSGFVRITAQVGCEVVRPVPSEVADFYKMFAQIEGLIGQFAAERASPEELAALRLTNEQISSIPHGHPETAELYRKLNVVFHKQLHTMARSPLVCSRQLANFALSDFYLVQAGVFEQHIGHVSGEHDRIIDAIARRDVAEADRCAKEHIDSVAKGLADRLENLQRPT